MKTIARRKAVTTALAAWSVAALLWAPARAFAQEQALTLEEAIRIALAANEASLSADQDLVQADAALTRARAYFLPAINISGNYTRRPFETVRNVGGIQAVIQSYNALSGSANLSMILFDSHSIPTLRQAKFNRMAELFGIAGAKRSLAFEVGNAFLSTLGVDQVLEASRSRLELAQQTLTAAKARFEAGLVSGNDVTRAELEYATAEQGLIQAQGQVETTYLELGYLLNSPPPSRLVSPDLLLKATDSAIPPVEQLIGDAAARRPDVQELRWRSQSLHALKLEPLLKWLPSFTLTGRYTYTNEAGLTGRNFNWNVGVSMGWSIFDGFGRNADYSDRKAAAIQSDLSLQAALRRVERDIRDALISLESQRATLKLAQAAYDVAQKNARETAELYRQGLSSALEVADANYSLFDANVSLVRARYGLGTAYLTFEAALGLDPLGKEPEIEKK
jgi:outer membrane protein TolC